jgi:hypothetical protein
MRAPVVVPNAQAISRRIAGFTLPFYFGFVILALGAAGVLGAFALEGVTKEQRRDAACRARQFPDDHFRTLDACLSAFPDHDFEQFGGMAAIALLLAIGAGALGIRARRSVHPFFRVLAQTPERVVWLYTMEYRYRAAKGAVGWGVNIGLIDGKTLTLPMRKEEAEPTMAALAHQMPWVTLGYSDATKKVFSSNPEQLRRG